MSADPSPSEIPPHHSVTHPPAKTDITGSDYRGWTDDGAHEAEVKMKESPCDSSFALIITANFRVSTAV